MDSFNDVMDAVKAYCKGRVSDASYRVFIQDLNLLNFEGTNIIILEVPNDVVMRFAAARYADHFGYAFQIRDDMLDVLGDAAKLGKATHVDENKNTFVRLYGIGACSKMIESETKTAIDALGCFENSDFLVEMARQLALREY